MLADLFIAVTINASPKGTPLKYGGISFLKGIFLYDYLTAQNFVPLNISLIDRKQNKMIIMIRQICSALADDTEKGQTKMPDLSVWPRTQSSGEKSEGR